MIRATMSVAAVAPSLEERAAYARGARWDRFRAALIDIFVYGFISLLVNSVYGVAHIENFPQITIGGGGFTTAIPVPFQWLLAFAYFIVSEAMFGATPGKWWAHLKVVRLDGAPLTFRDVFVRNLLRVVDSLPFLYLVGGAFVMNTRGSQRLGDIAAGTTVVSEVYAREPGATRTSTRRAHRTLAAVLALAVVYTIVFSYFGRPPLAIQGEFNQRWAMFQTLDSYELGSPTWGIGTVTYPIRGRAGSDSCTGSIEMRWDFPVGWVDNGGGMSCVPS